MKIGIVTYHRSHNYGAMLQAVALQKVLAELGHDARFVDYWPKHQVNIYRLWNSYTFSKLNVKGKLVYVFYYIYTFLPKMLRRMRFNRFCKDFIIPYCSSEEMVYDVIIYGSDQIWRKQYWGKGYNPVYFGINEFKAKKHVSYAASMGKLPTAKEEIDIVVRYVSSLNSISVRERNLKELLESNGVKSVRQTLDPTLLLGKQRWENMIRNRHVTKEPYLLLYDLQIGVFDKKYVVKIAQANNLRVKEIVGTASKLPTASVHTIDGPYEFLSDIKNASFVLTSSFHGLAFSIIFNKPFYASFRENADRAESLLKSLDIFDRLLPCGTVFQSLDASINWNVVNSKLMIDAQESINFIKEEVRL